MSKIFGISDYIFLNEIFKSEIIDLADPDRKNRANRITINFTKFNFRKKIASFTAIDPAGSGKRWVVEVEIADLKQISKAKKNEVKEKVLMAYEAGDIKIFCNCPDFLYKGYKYISYELDFGMKKEVRKPKIRNPKEDGSGCKHTIAVLEKFTQYIDLVVKAYQDSSPKKIKK